MGRLSQLCAELGDMLPAQRAAGTWWWALRLP